MFKMKWVHIDFFFRYFYQDEKFLFEELVRKIVRQTRWIVRRKFYLYEPQPTLLSVPIFPRRLPSMGKEGLGMFIWKPGTWHRISS